MKRILWLAALLFPWGLVLLALLAVLAHAGEAEEAERGLVDWKETALFLRYFPAHNEPDPLISGLGGVARWQLGGRTQLRLYRLGDWELRTELEPTLSLLVPWPDGVESDQGGTPDFLQLSFRAFVRRGGLEFGIMGNRAFWFDGGEPRDRRYFTGVEIRWVFGR